MGQKRASNIALTNIERAHANFVVNNDMDRIIDIFARRNGRDSYLRGCEAIRVINWDEFVCFFFFFFVMVVANCNASCYWLHVHCSQWQLLLFFPFGIKIAFVAIWRVSCGELVYCLTRCTNPEIVAKGEHILCTTSC